MLLFHSALWEYRWKYIWRHSWILTQAQTPYWTCTHTRCVLKGVIIYAVRAVIAYHSKGTSSLQCWSPLVSNSLLWYSDCDYFVTSSVFANPLDLCKILQIFLFSSERNMRVCCYKVSTWFFNKKRFSFSSLRRSVIPGLRIKNTMKPSIGL